jgi:ferredoxin-NADP reductase
LGLNALITVERLPNGAVSPYLTQELAVGDRLELRGPIGGWFVWRAEQTEPIQLVARGSGIVPLMAMIRSRAFSASTAPFRLLYSVREPGAIFYRDELQALSDRNHPVVITYAYARATPKDWPHRQAASTPLLSRTRPGLRTLSRLATFAARHRSLKVLPTSLSPRVTAAIRSGRSVLAPQEDENELTYC